MPILKKKSVHAKKKSSFDTDSIENETSLENEPALAEEALFDNELEASEELKIFNEEESEDLESEKSTPEHLDADQEQPLDYADVSTKSSLAEKVYSKGESREYDPTVMYLGQISISPLLTAEEEVHYGRLALKGDVSARNRMIESNLRLVVKVARRYLNRGVAFGDLIEEGNLGLIHAVSKFDPERGFRFSTYATWWIRQTIERAIMGQTRHVRLPVHIVKEMNVCLRAIRELTQKNHGTEPTAQQIAAHIKREVKDVERMLKLNEERTTSADTPLDDDAERTVLDTIADTHNIDPAQLHNNDHLKEQIESCLMLLHPKQREIIARRFGLLGYDKLTLEDVGDSVKLTRERVRQIQIDGLRRLRHLLEEKGINPMMFAE